MFGMGMGEIIVILIVALLVLGPNKLPDAAKSIGKGIRELRKHSRDLQSQLDKDETIGGTMREIKSALRGEDAPPPRPTLTAAPPQQAIPRPPRAAVEAAPTPSPSPTPASTLTPSPPAAPQALGAPPAPATPAPDADLDPKTHG